jgi:hypothetical protein
LTAVSSRPSPRSPRSDFWRHHLAEQLRGPAVDGEFGNAFARPTARARRARQLADVAGLLRHGRRTIGAAHSLGWRQNHPTRSLSADAPGSKGQPHGKHPRPRAPSLTGNPACATPGTPHLAQSFDLENPTVNPTERRGGRPWRRARSAWLAANPDINACAECGKFVDRSLPGTHKDGPIIDHVHPLLLGGDELPTDPNALRLVCAACNTARSNRIRAQIRKRRYPRFTSDPGMRNSRQW